MSSSPTKVVYTTLADGDTLVYNAATDTWINSPTSGGGANLTTFAGGPHRLPARDNDVARWRFDRDIMSIISPYVRAGETMNTWPDEVGVTSNLGLMYLLGNPPTATGVTAPTIHTAMSPTGRPGLITSYLSCIAHTAPGTLAPPVYPFPAALRPVSKTIRALVTFPMRGSYGTPLTDIGLANGNNYLWLLGGWPGGGTEPANVQSQLYWNYVSSGATRRTALVHVHNSGAAHTLYACYWTGFDPGPGTFHFALSCDDIGGGLCRYRLSINGISITARGVNSSNVSLETATFPVPTGGDGNASISSLILGNRIWPVWNPSNGSQIWHDFAITSPAMTDEEIAADFQASRLVS
jgi:hypothetical protein